MTHPSDLEKQILRYADSLLPEDIPLKSLFFMSPDPALIMNDDTLFILCNKAALEVLGIDDMAPILGKHPIDISPEYQPDGETSIEKAKKMFDIVRKKKIHRFKWECIRQNGEHFLLEVTVSKLDIKGEKLYYCLWKDLTDHNKALRSSLKATIKILTAALEARDSYTAGHERRVAEIAEAIAIEMCLSDNVIEGIKLGGLVHDIGKVQTPSDLLSKPSKLSDIEHMLIQQHAYEGYSILNHIDFPWPIAEIALQHHERIDGSGYPQGLKGVEICLEARIIAVADVVEAISSHRPYRPALGIEVAINEITENRGKYYDTGVVDACLSLYSKKELPCV